MAERAGNGILPEVRAGFAALSVSEATRAAAERHFAAWLTEPEYEAYRPLLEHLAAARAFPLLLDCFYQVLPFGTGGRRGPVGPGPNRFNPTTLATSVAGHVEFLREQFAGQRLQVVIGYDSRSYHDVRGLYPRELLGPLAGLTSRGFAELAARVYLAAGIEVALSPRIMATPELSFAIRELKAQGGLVISASHNPPDDNGGKFYDHRGGQAVPPEDQAMVDRVAGVRRVATAPDLAGAGTIPEDVHRAYLAVNLALRTRPEPGGAIVVLTPLHGTGMTTAGDVLRAAGFDPAVPAGQDEPDGRFPTVPFGVANPEVPESMQLAVEEGRRRHADLVLATDPDADRIGAVVPDPKGGERFLNGNEIGALVVDEVLRERRRLGTLPPNPIVIKTEVTSELVARVARAGGARVIGDLLVGFKYVAAVLDQLERTGRYRDLEGRATDFVAGVEESHGVLLTPAIRDKDAAGPALVLAEMAARRREAGESIPAALDDLHRRHGYVANRLTSMVMRGAAGKEAIDRIQNELRRSPPRALGRFAVARMIDHWDEGPGARFGPILSETDRASRNVLVFQLEDGARAIIRPSGTEPKNKTYIEVAGEPLAPGEDLAAVRAMIDARAQEIEEALVAHCLGILGIQLPAYALRISGLVALDDKVDFATRFLPELTARARAPLAAGDPGPAAAELGRWIDTRLQRYGKDPRLLTREAFAAYLEEDAAKGKGDAERARLRALMRAAWEA